MWVPFPLLSICYWASQALSARLPASSFRPLGCFFAMLSVVAMDRYHVSRWLRKGKLTNERLVCLASVVEQLPVVVNRSANEPPWACLACSAPKKVPSACFASRRCLHSGRKCEHLCRYLYRSHSKTIYEIQLQKTILLQMQPRHEATLTQPLQCDLQRLSYKHNRTTRNWVGNCRSKTGSRRQSEKKTILKHFLKGFLKGKLLAPKWRKSADKSLSQPSCSHSNTIYEIQLQKTILLQMQPRHEATLTQPLQCDLQRLSYKHNRTTRNWVGNCRSKTGSRRLAFFARLGRRPEKYQNPVTSTVFITNRCFFLLARSSWPMVLTWPCFNPHNPCAQNYGGSSLPSRPKGALGKAVCPG